MEVHDHLRVYDGADEVSRPPYLQPVSSSSKLTSLALAGVSMQYERDRLLWRLCLCRGDSGRVKGGMDGRQRCGKALHTSKWALGREVKRAAVEEDELTVFALRVSSSCL